MEKVCSENFVKIFSSFENRLNAVFQKRTKLIQGGNVRNPKNAVWYNYKKKLISKDDIANGVNLKTVLNMTRKIREITEIPIILFSYYNPILAYGNEIFYKDALTAGADGVLLVDLPPEESDEMTDCWKGNELSLIRLIAPTTPIYSMDEQFNF